MSIKKLIENELAKAETVLAAKDLVDRLQKALEDVNKMRVEDLPDLAETLQAVYDAGSVQSFVDSVNGSMEQLISSLEQTRDSVDSAGKQLTGAQDSDVEMPSMLGTDSSTDDMEADDDSTDMSMTAPASGGEDISGRETRESVQQRRAALVERAQALALQLEKAKSKIKSSK